MKIWDIDGDGNVGVFSDALMILKWIIGYRGDDLTDSGSLIVIGSPRDTNAAIEGYLEMIEPYLDFNGDGVVDFIDGWMIVLAEVGFTGINLTNSNTRPAATRTTYEELHAYHLLMITDNP